VTGGYGLADVEYSSIIRNNTENGNTYSRFESPTGAGKSHHPRDRTSYASVRDWLKGRTPGCWALDLISARTRNKVVSFTGAHPHSSVLDVATGTGKQAFAYSRKGHEVVGIDFSPPMLSIAKEKNCHANVRFDIADAANMPFDDGYFDVSCISFALHEMPITIREQVVSEMARVTKHNGAIVIADFSLSEAGLFRHILSHCVTVCCNSKYYTEFIQSALDSLFTGTEIEMTGSAKILGGIGMVLRGVNRRDVA